MLGVTLVAAVLPPGVVVDHEGAASRQYIGSPSIVKCRDGAYVSSHDFFGAGSTQSFAAVSRTFRSEDKGRTWAKTAEMKDQFWSNLFEHRKALYLMGTTYEYGRVVIRKSTDCGKTWSEASYLTTETGFHTAPVPIAIHDGRIWRGMEWHPEGKWGFFEALAVSAPVKSDLMKPESWRFEPRVKFPKETAPVGDHWLEGNLIVAPDGKLVNILRVANKEYAALLRDGKADFVAFPGGAKKFTIRWDKKSRLYWTLSNPALDKYPMSAINPASVRNTLALMSSPDLRTWTVKKIVLEHPDVEKHAFQYVDWQFDGKDLIVASRTAFDDETGGAHRAHDANYLTFHRIVDFRESAETR
jgi:hypothetical protein